MIKKIISVLLIISVFLLVSGCKKEETNIYDNNDKLISTADIITESENFAYIDIVMREADTIISKLNNCDEKSARNLLLKGKYKIYTYCDQGLIKTIKKVYSEVIPDVNFGCAISNLNGNLIAAYSGSESLETNFAIKKTPPYSTFKPLAVYAPAIESKKITWSTLFEDSPYKILEDEYGIKRDWPANATGIYSNKQVTPFIAIKESLNTVAVKCLSQYGVNNSIDFLKTKFNINLDLEQYKSTIYGEEEVIGNIALGYTNAGCSPVEMAGYYQIFANGGYYKTPKTIKKIVDNKGNTLYENKEEAVQVISSETSYIMNELLKGVITPGGTGEKAYCADIAVAGKTGTGDDNLGNWFVGVTPEFSCAVWHSEYNKTNYATQFFSGITKKANINNKVFMTSENVVKKIYCTESGKLLSSDCKSVEIGYFATNNIPNICDLH